MKGPRFSLRWLLGTASFLGVGCGLLFYARPLTACLVFSGTLLLLFAAVVFSIYRRGEQRAFWFGFAFFGLAYLAIICGPWHAPDTHLAMVDLRDRLPMTKLLDLAFEWVPTKPVAAPTGNGGLGGGMFGQMGSGGMMGPRATGSLPITDPGDFFLTGQSLWAIAISVAGGLFTRWCQRSG
jgi:hypothetical protein